MVGDRFTDAAGMSRGPTDGVVTLRPRERTRDGQTAFSIEVEGRRVGEVDVTVRDEIGLLDWALYAGCNGRGYATRALRLLCDHSFDQLDLYRVEARVDPENRRSLRLASRAGLRREGIVRARHARSGVSEYVLLGRLAADPHFTDPEGFRALLNATLPRKRAIAQLLVRDPAQRILLCQLTYKHDWDLPGGVVEPGESPHLGASREAHEELGLVLRPGRLLVADWLPPWSGWDDAMCLLFDGGMLDPGAPDRMTLATKEIRSVAFCTMDEVERRAADFTFRRIVTAMATLTNPAPGAAYTQSGRT